MEKLKMLVIAPHPDDSIIGVGGTMARVIKSGGEVTVLTIAAHMPPLFSEEVFQKTIDETKKAFAKLGVERYIFKNIPALSVNKLKPIELNKILSDTIKDVSPNILFIPFIDRNIDHSVIFKSAMVSSRPISPEDRISVVACYEVISSTYFNAPNIEPNFIPNWVVDISPYIDIKIDALKCCDSQVKSMPHPLSLEASRALALFRGSQVGMNYGEGFQIVRMTTLPENLR